LIGAGSVQLGCGARAGSPVGRADELRRVGNALDVGGAFTVLAAVACDVGDRDRPSEVVSRPADVSVGSGDRDGRGVDLDVFRGGCLDGDDLGPPQIAVDNTLGFRAVGYAGGHLDGVAV